MTIVSEVSGLSDCWDETIILHVEVSDLGDYGFMCDEVVKAYTFGQQVPLAHVPEPVYKTSVDWINQRPVEALGGFVLWAFDCILTDLAAHQGGAKGGKKGAQQTPSKSQVLFASTHQFECI